jgi:hypothetical protein
MLPRRVYEGDSEQKHNKKHTLQYQETADNIIFARFSNRWVQFRGWGGTVPGRVDSSGWGTVPGTPDNEPL